MSTLAGWHIKKGHVIWSSSYTLSFFSINRNLAWISSWKLTPLCHSLFYTRYPSTVFSLHSLFCHFSLTRLGESCASFQGWVWNEETPTHSLHTLHHHFLLLWCLSLPLFVLQKWIPALLTPGFLEEIKGESASHRSSIVSLFLAP